MILLTALECHHLLNILTQYITEHPKDYCESTMHIVEDRITYTSDVLRKIQEGALLPSEENKNENV